MTRKATLPKITECIDPMPREVSVNDGRMIHALAAFVVLGFLALGHVHLQFLRTDMKFQQRELQKKVTELMQQEQRLARSNEAFCDTQRLKTVAQRERMKEVDVRQQLVAVVPTRLTKKYAEPVRGGAEMPTAIANLGKKPAKLSERLLSLLDIGEARAATPPSH